MPTKKTLKPGEFAITPGKIVTSKATLHFSQLLYDGTVDMTIKVNFKPQQVVPDAEPETSITVGDCGVFHLGKQHAKGLEKQAPDMSLSISAGAVISISSNTFYIETDGQKGEHGTGFVGTTKE